jgi:hypothetical protein
MAGGVGKYAIRMRVSVTQSGCFAIGLATLAALAAFLWLILLDHEGILRLRLPKSSHSRSWAQAV